MEVKFKKVRIVKSPERGTTESAGIDLFVPYGFKETNLKPNESILIPAGIVVDIPKGTMLKVDNKSGVASKKKLIVGATIIDSDYQGEIHINVHNIGQEEVIIKPAMKIVQMIHQPVFLSDLVEVQNIHEEETQRGSGGFGSTGE